MTNISPNIKAEILVEALPYIQEFAGQVVVIKYGGNAMINEELKAAVIQDVVLLNLIGIKVVLVHGGGPEIKEMLEKINSLGIGPGGLGGRITAFAVNINTYPTHIAGLPVAVNICCHVNRHVTEVL